MAKYEFKQAVIVRGGAAGIGGKSHLFSKGVHEISDEKVKVRVGEDEKEVSLLDHPTIKHFAKHGLIVPFKPKDAPQTLKPASSDIAKGAEAAAKAVLEPDAEIGGDDAEPDFSDDDEKHHHHGKKKKGK